MKVYIITGASGDIGTGIAALLAKNGCALTLCGNKNQEALEAIAAHCARLHAPVFTLCGDLSEENFAKQIVAKTIQRFGHLDGIIHCAGVADIRLFTDTTRADWDRLIDANLTAAYQITHAAVPALLAGGGGRILLLSSVWGSRGASCEVIYSAAKGGMNAFTKALAKELALSHISVNALALGMVDTKMNACLTEEERASVCEEIPMGRSTTPQEVARMVSLLLDAPEYLTGQIIGFDGGWY